MPGSLSYIVLYVKDLDRAVAFYRDVMGLRVHLEDAGHFVRLHAGGADIAFHAVDDPARVSANRDLELDFSVDDVDAAYDTLAGRGVAFDSPPENMPWGFRVAHFRDPEGWMVSLNGPSKNEQE